MQNAPGAGGYLVAWAVAVVTYSAMFAAATSLSEGTGPGTALPVFVIYGCAIGAASIPFALVGVAVVHLTCRTAQSQWTHVLVAGGTGLLPTAVLAGLGGSEDVVFWLMIPLATAIGRWSVVPLVRKRQRAAFSPAAPAAS